MYSIITTNRFEKEVKICKKRGYDMTLLQKAIVKNPKPTLRIFYFLDLLQTS